MATLKYKGSSHFRVISSAAFKELGLGGETPPDLHVAGQSLKKFPARNPKNIPFEVEVPDDIAEYLLKNEKSDWGKVAEKTETPDAGEGTPDVDAPDASTAGSGETPASKGAGKGK